MSELNNYINDCENDWNNFYMGRWYETQNHYSPAAGFYLRALERSDNLDLKYESLLRMFSCYTKLEKRDNTAEMLLKQAIHLAPDRPEAYFTLAQYHEYRKNWLDTYLYSELGLQTECKSSKLLYETDYPGKYGFYFQKASSSWWLGKSQQCRKLYQYILENYIDDLGSSYKQLLQHNLSHLGSGPESQAFRKYRKNMHDRLKFKFDGSENINENFAQTYQDLFILAILNGKRNGTYLEVGSARPFEGNNTALLEKDFGWTGVGLELKSEFINDYRSQRKNPVLNEDALQISYNKLLKDYFPGKFDIDYLQLDIEPAKNTFDALLCIPFEKYRFAIITYEHDYYVDITKSFREKSRRYLQSLGYELVVNDISPNDDSAFEDWWIHPELVDKSRLDLMKNVDLSKTHHIERYMLHGV